MSNVKKDSNKHRDRTMANVLEKKRDKRANMILAESTVLSKTEEHKATDEEVDNAIVYSGNVTSIDFMMPEQEREILERNLNLYSDVEKMEKTLNIAKKNKYLSEQLKTLDLISKTGEVSAEILDLMTKPENLKVLEEYIQRKFDEGDIAKAYKEIGLMSTAMLDARKAMLYDLKNTKTGKKAKIALKFTNDSGEDFQLGAEVNM